MVKFYLITLLLCGLHSFGYGQRLVANINQGNAGSDPVNLQSGGGFAIFAAGEAYDDKILYVIMATGGEVKPFRSTDNEQVTNPLGAKLIDGNVYYYTHGDLTTSYYRADLTTRVVTELGTLPSPGANGGDPEFTKVAGGVIFFHVSVDYERQLYTTDGTPMGMRMLFALPQEEYPGRIVPFGNRALIEFSGNRDSESVYGLSDGTEAGSGIYYPSDGSTEIFALSILGSALIVHTRVDREANLYLIEPGESSLTPTSEGIPTLPQEYVGGYASGQGYTYYLNTGPGTKQLLGRIDTTTRSAETVLDLNPTGEGPRAGFLQVFDELIFYLAYDPATRLHDLYRTDGTRAGTFSLMEGITARSVNGFSLGEMVAAGDGTYYFLADRAASGTELWHTDGTRAGTKLVKDLYPGPDGAEIDQLTALGGSLLFVADSPEFGRELFITDGTAAGTKILDDLNEREAGSNPNRFLTYNDTLYFSATSGCTGYELFKSGGTAAATSLLADLEVGRESTFTTPFVPLGDQAYFGVNGIGGDTDRLFKTNGSTTEDMNLAQRAGSSRISLSGPGKAGDRLVILGFFTGIGQALYAYDPGSDSLTLLKIFEGGGANSFGGDTFIPLRDGIVLFQQITQEFGQELWRTDGTAAGTYMVKDIRRVEENTIYGHIGELHVIDGLAYFSADPGFGSRPYRSDGTEAGTYELSGNDFLVSPRNFVKYAGRVYFSTGLFGNYRIYSTGGQEGDVEETELTRGLSDLQYIDNLTVLGDKMVFTAFTEAMGSELWAAASATGTAAPLGDLNAGPADSYPRDLTVLGDKLYFSVELPELGRELWATDGTPQGTVLIADINPGTASSDPENLFVYKDRLYFSANNGIVGAELWRYSPNGDDEDLGDPNVINIICQLPTDTTTSITEIPSVEVSVFPNPTSDWAVVTLKNGSKAVVATIYAPDGRLVYRSNAAALRHELPVAHLASGNYFIHVYEPGRGATATMQLMVVH